jgi:hypothetical protein
MKSVMATGVIVKRGGRRVTLLNFPSRLCIETRVGDYKRQTGINIREPFDIPLIPAALIHLARLTIPSQPR